MGMTSRPLEIDSDLVLTSPEGAKIRVRSQAKRLHVDLDPRLVSLTRGRVLPSRATRRELLVRVQWFLRRADLSVAVSVRGALIADLDGSGTGSWSAKLLGLAPMRLHLRGLLMMLWTTRR
jgi:hypothetical protein